MVPARQHKPTYKVALCQACNGHRTCQMISKARCLWSLLLDVLTCALMTSISDGDQVEVWPQKNGSAPVMPTRHWIRSDSMHFQGHPFNGLPPNLKPFQSLRGALEVP